jgi:hypothetical protein
VAVGLNWFLLLVVLDSMSWDASVYLCSSFCLCAIGRRGVSIWEISILEVNPVCISQLDLISDKTTR